MMLFYTSELLRPRFPEEYIYIYVIVMRKVNVKSQILGFLALCNFVLRSSGARADIILLV